MIIPATLKFRWAAFLRRGSLTGFGWCGIAILTFWLAVAIIGPLLLPYNENTLPFPDAYDAFQVPQPGAWLGTDAMDRDVLTRLVYGSGRTLGISFTAATLAYFLGIVLGVSSATLGGWTDVMMSRTSDAFLSLPNIMLGLVCIAALGSSIPMLIAVVAFVYTPIVFRLGRALAADLVHKDFVECARLRGEGLWWIISREIWPNIWMPLISDYGLRLVYVILFVSSLGFLGLGIQPPYADWGSMVRENLGALQFGRSLVPVMAPAVAIASVTMALSFIVDDLSSSVARRGAKGSGRQVLPPASPVGVKDK